MFIGTFLLCSIAVTLMLRTFINWLKKVHYEWKYLVKIPSPPAYPIIGHLPEMLRCGGHQWLTRYQINRMKYYPIYKEWALLTKWVRLLHPEDIKIILTGQNNIKNLSFLHTWLGSGLLTSNGGKWRCRRKMLTPTFHLNSLEDFVPILNRQVNSMINAISISDYMDVRPHLSKLGLHFLKEVVMGSDLDLNEHLVNNYFKNIVDIANIVMYRTGRPWIYRQEIYSFTPAARKERIIVKRLHDFTQNLLNMRNADLASVSRKQTAFKTMIDLLLLARQNGADVDDKAIREEIDTAMFAGHDTTSTSLTYCLMALAAHREIQDAIFREICTVIGNSHKEPSFDDLRNLKYTEQCIKEALRLYPAVPALMRRTTEDVKTFTGYVIPVGTTIYIDIFYLHRNPCIFKNPDKFNPERFSKENLKKIPPFSYIPFSAGSRNCIGQKLAMLEMKATLCAIIRKFIIISDKPPLTSFRMDMLLRPTEDIRVKFIPRTYIQEPDQMSLP